MKCHRTSSNGGGVMPRHATVASVTCPGVGRQFRAQALLTFDRAADSKRYRQPRRALTVHEVRS